MGVFDTAGGERHLLIDALKWVQGPKGILADNPHLAPALHHAHTMERFDWDIANGVGEGGFPRSGRANDRGQRARVDGELWHNYRGGLTIFQLNIVEMTQWSSGSGGANDSLLTDYVVVNRGKGQLMKIGCMTNMTLLNMFPVFKCHNFIGRTNLSWRWANAKSYKLDRGSPVFTVKSGQNHRF